MIASPHLDLARRLGTRYASLPAVEAVAVAGSRVPCPEPLRAAIVACNHPALRTIITAVGNQLAKAAPRGDLVSVIHRLDAFLATEWLLPSTGAPRS